jgi:hypothetical protein
MSKVILLFVAIMTFSFYICISACIHIGHLHSTPSVLGLLDELICSKHECFTPHNSEDSLQRSSEDYIIIQRELEARENGLIHLDRYDVRFWRNLRGEILVVEIRSATDHGLVSLGSLVAFYGAPCSVTFTEESINLQYPDFFATIKAEYDLSNPDTLHLLLSPSMQVASISLQSNLTCKKPVTFAASQNITTNWQGFRSVGFYISHKSR